MGLRTTLNLILLLLAASTNSLPSFEEDRLLLKRTGDKDFPGAAASVLTLKTTRAPLDTTVKQTTLPPPPDTSSKPTTLPVDVKCPSFYEPHDGLCLFFAIFSKANHGSALSTCSTFNNGYLAVVDDPQKLDIIITTIKTKGLDDNDFWIDGSNSAGTWAYKDKRPFVNGTPFWAASETFHTPDLEGVACAALTSGYDYLISDEECDDQAFPLCQADPLSIHESNVQSFQSTRAVSCPQFFLNVYGSCLGFLFWAEEPWTESKLTCESIGGTLYASNDINQLRSIYEFLHESGVQSHSFWIGGTDEDHEGNWTWDGGIPITMGTPFWGIRDAANDSEPIYADEDTKVEPDGGVKENCLALTAEGMHYFRDKDCSSMYNPLCMAKPLP